MDKSETNTFLSRFGKVQQGVVSSCVISGNLHELCLSKIPNVTSEFKSEHVANKECSHQQTSGLISTDKSLKQYSPLVFVGKKNCLSS